MKPRHVESCILEALSDTPVVLLHGARQVGKTTLVKAIMDAGYHAEYATLDDVATLSAIHSDPIGFLSRYQNSVAIDEVQRSAELLLSIKAEVDRRRKPGQFLLTGSANILMLPTLADSLAGRMEIITLWPLSQAEIEGVRINFVDIIFSKPSSIVPSTSYKKQTRENIIARILRGGYPEAVARQCPERREAWFRSYLTTILERDIRDLANIERLDEMPRLLALLVTRASGIVSYSDLASSLSIPLSTLKRYFALLEQIFLIRRLPAWASNRGIRLIKSPKVHVCDTGLGTSVAGIDADFLKDNPNALGHLLENFIVMEVIKQLGWSKTGASPFHFRTSAGQEVDLVLERRSGELVGIEIKASETVRSSDFNGLRTLKRIAGEKMKLGLVIHLGSNTTTFGEQLLALPVSALWTPSNTNP